MGKKKKSIKISPEKIILVHEHARWGVTMIKLDEFDEFPGPCCP